MSVEGAEVKKGSTVTLTCKISNFRPEGVTVTWKDGSEKTLDGTNTNLNGIYTSLLKLSNVQADASYTCVVKSKEFPGSESSEKIVQLKTYGSNFKLQLGNFY